MKPTRLVLAVLVLAVVALAGLAVRAAAGERPFAQAHPAPGKLVGEGSSRLHLLDRGTGEPAVVMIHGAPGLARDFDSVADRLAPTHRVLSVDRPGFGSSGRARLDLPPAEQARLIHDAVSQLGVRRPVVVGFSFGGPVALAWAEEFPEDVRALVLVAPLASPDLHPRLPLLQRALAWPGVGPALAWSLGGILGPGAIEAGYADAFAPARPDPGALERGRLFLARPLALQAFAHDWGSLDEALPRIAARYGELRTAVEVLHARTDKIVPFAHAEYLAVHLPGAHLVEVPGAGHQLPYTHPAHVEAAVARALQRSGGAP